jgi:hypothetical protein
VSKEEKVSIMDDGKTYVELTIAYDEDCENPMEYTGWTLVDFRRGYGDDPRTIDDFFERDGEGGVRPHIGFRSKIKAGTAFVLDRYTHSGDHWYLHTGRDFAFDPGGWDTSHYAGVLIHDGKPQDAGKDYAEREERAEGVIDTFNRWLSGDCYWYSVEGLDDFDFDDSCGDFIGSEYVCENIRSELPPQRPLVIVYAKGDTDEIAWADHKWGEGVETMTMFEYREMIEEREEELDLEGDDLAESERLEMVA